MEEYYLSGAREMASGFLLKDDETFQFFFSYGALDRQGSGKWSKENGEVVFQTIGDQVPSFSLINSSKTSGKEIILTIDVPNPVLRSSVFASPDMNDSENWQQADKHGMIRLPLKSIDTLNLVLEFCPDRMATFPITTKDHNEFIFRMNPSIMEVYFDQFKLKLKGDQMIGGHPLMKGDAFVFQKS